MRINAITSFGKHAQKPITQEEFEQQKDAQLNELLIQMLPEFSKEGSAGAILVDTFVKDGEVVSVVRQLNDEEKQPQKKESFFEKIIKKFKK